ncbi:hypothetical protein B7P43_G03164 [Cryptotermes secundus]|uniref:Uncharacterized protein n=1 Tax=Cryptotermes secundus TaxID=105785 RepID=A0A2J7PKV1_9NEOP|nr:hypothetical protein B7P43_G03164 [Cryptotermes secundus]
MKLAILLALCCLIFGVYASPIVTVDSQNQPTAAVSKSGGVDSGRQTSVEAGPAPVAAPAVTDDDEDDDDDDDDIDLDITEDDDDDDDESEDEEDDDDDDDYFERFFDDILGDDDDDDDDEIEDVVGDDVIEAKRSRSLEASSGNAVPPIYITKYNRFVDSILERINRILRKNYDPVNVRLHNNSNKDKSNSKRNNKNKNRTRRPPASKKGNMRPSHRSEDIARSTTEAIEATMNESLAAISAQLIAEHSNAEQVSLIHNSNSTDAAATDSNVTATTTELATTKRSSNNGMISRARPQKQHHRNKNNKKTKKNKNKGRQRPGAKATLYGLSSVRREGDVTVNMMSSHTTVRTKFTVGPLILKVEKEFGRGAKKDIRSATATTTEMIGKLNLRVLHGGAATLHSIRVMQPKQVRVESSDDHDKTREYVWKRSSHIAHVVSQKLTNATKSMLQPPPIPNSSITA